MQTLCTMIFARCVRTFDAGDGAAISVSKDFAFLEAPTMGTKLTFAGEDLPALEVVGVTMVSQDTEIGIVIAGVEVALAVERLTALDVALGRGWIPRERVRVMEYSGHGALSPTP